MNRSQTLRRPRRPAAKNRRVASSPGRAPWRILKRDRPTLFAAAMLAMIVLSSLCAPLYATYVSGTDPFRSSLSARIMVDGKRVKVMQASTEGLGLGVTPIGPTWGPQYLLGADTQGRDVAARLLYGGRNSLLIATTSHAICLCLAPSSAFPPVSSAAGWTRSCRVSSTFSGPSRSTCSPFPSPSSSSRRASSSARSRSRRQPAAADLHHRHHLRALCRAPRARDAYWH